MSVEAGDTAERSLAHWSEKGRQEMDAFYALADEDYRQLALAVSWGASLGRLSGLRGRELRLLDVACGSGRFPAALQRYAGLGRLPVRIDYDLLDPSEFALMEARGKLAAPFRGGADLQVALQDLEPPGELYDVVWSTHGLYALPPAQLRPALRRFVGAMAPWALGVLAQATSRSHYLAFYDAYLASFRPEGTPYVSAEQLAATLDRVGRRPRVQALRYTTSVPADDTATLEGFLQRCAFDDTVGLAEMQADMRVGAYLEACRQGDRYVFAHEVALLVLDADGRVW